MNARKLRIISVISILLIIIGVTGYLFTRSHNARSSSSTEQSVTSQTPSVSGSQEDSNQTAVSDTGTYTLYTPENLAATTGTRILFFHAPWCPQCRELEASIQTGTIPLGITIFKVDYDTNQALRKTYGVTLQTTLVKLDGQGNMVEKFVAYDNPSLEAVIESLL